MPIKTAGNDFLSASMEVRMYGENKEGRKDNIRTKHT